MKNGDDFKKALGNADSAFENKVKKTLYELETQEEEKTVKKFSASFALVMGIILLVAVAFAAASQWGIMDFMERHGRVIPKATELVQSDIAQQGGKTEAGQFTLRDAMLDGKDIYMVVAVKPADKNTMLLSLDAMLEDPASNMGPLYADETVSIREYAMAKGKTKLYYVDANPDPDCVQAKDFILEEDGTLVLILMGEYDNPAESFEISLSCIVIPYKEDELDIEKRQDVPLTFTLDDVQMEDTAVYKVPQVYADCGVQVDEIVLAKSTIATHVKITFSVVDESAFKLTGGGLWFEFLDEKGERIDGGPMGMGSIGEVEGTNGQIFIQEDSLIAVDKLPKTITLRGYNCWEKNRYETHTFQME